MKEPKGIEYVCEKCGKQATINLQNVWKEFEIIKDSKFRLNKEWEGDNNEFYCEKCYEKEMAITN